MTPPRATVSGAGANRSRVIGEQTRIPSHVVVIPGIGDVLFHHALAANVSEITVGDSDNRIALQIADAGYKCGCGARGRGMILTPGPEEARLIAERLVQIAEQYEARAAAQASAAIREAAGK
ncbi:MAG: hypothetical protein P0Y64_01970 [Candidatus Sphingomonas colombiensis]|nr:hypothetical protein [Sphingomonas sp.]WEK43622.1 MAG: hypothetical protein P0Y64_01970 [Sphingomonas sp.]